MVREHKRTASGASSGRTSLLLNALSAASAVAVVAVGILAIMWLADLSGGPTAADSDRTATAKAAKAHKVKRASLAEATTHTSLARAPIDTHRYAATDGTVVHPTKVIQVYDRPQGRPFGKVGPTQIGDTWLPVIAQTRGWVQVLLPSKPNGSTGWLRAGNVERAHTPYLISVHLGSMLMELFSDGRQIADWEIGIGKPGTPTPTGRTFLLGSIVDPNQQYSPVILPLGTHSATLDSFGGGPGTVAIHTWPTTDVLGKADSHGCIRVSREALDRLTQVPLGTLVLVDQQ